jgi:hypothetical protein
MRNSYGFEEITLSVLPRPGRASSISGQFSTSLNDHVRWGLDTRIQIFRLDSTSSRQEILTGIFPMQAAIYLNVQATSRLDFFLAQYILQREAEFWVRLRATNPRAYLRAGRFQPAYGLRLDDHTSFVRGGHTGRVSIAGLSSEQQGFPFGPYFHGEGAVEGGLYLGDIYVTAHASNPSVLFKYLSTIQDLQWGLRAEIIRFMLGSTWMMGGSYLRERKVIFRTFFCGIQWNRFTLLAEVDLADNWVDPGVQSFAAYGEIDVRISQGWHAFIKMDTYDADTDPHLNRDDLLRMTLGGELFPAPFMELKPQLRYCTNSYNDDRTLDLLLQLHVYF